MKQTMVFLAAAALTGSMLSAYRPAAADNQQIIVSDTAELQAAFKNVKAGDEIILRPGIYEADPASGQWKAFLAEASGIPAQHIILRSEDPDNPATICGNTPAKKCALTIRGSYWEIRDLKIETR